MTRLTKDITTAFGMILLTSFLVSGCAKPLQEEIKKTQSDQKEDLSSEAGDRTTTPGQTDENTTEETTNNDPNSSLSAPKIVMQPETQRDVLLKSKVTLSIQAEGEPAPTIQWMKDGEVLQDKTGSEYVIESAFGETFNGEYYAVVKNSEGSVESEKVRIFPDKSEFKQFHETKNMLETKGNVHATDGWKVIYELLDSWGESKVYNRDCNGEVGMMVDFHLSSFSGCAGYNKGNYVCYRHYICDFEQYFAL